MCGLQKTRRASTRLSDVLNSSGALFADRCRMGMPRSIARLAQLSAAAALAAVSSGALPAQSSEIAPPTMTEECLGIAFGAWTPPLDAASAGHRQSGSFDTNPISRARHERDWALRLEAGRDTTLILFPAWWPAGVAVRVPPVVAASGDTLKGTATALVADVRTKAPTATVMLWRVPCGGR